MDWKKFQGITAQLFRQVGCLAEEEISIKGARAIHAVDVYVTFKNFGFEEKWIIECKNWKTNIPKEKVLALRSIVEDIGAHRGFIVSNKGFQSGAVSYSQNTNIDLITFNDLKMIIALNIVPLKELNINKCDNYNQVRRINISNEIIKKLKNPNNGDYAEIYRDYLLSNMCQKTQKSACIGLSKIDSTESVLILTERLTNFWGVGAIQSTIKALSKLVESGGILGLIATLFWDYRFYYEKLSAVSVSLKIQGNINDSKVIDKIIEMKLEEGLNFPLKLSLKIENDIDLLLGINNSDIKHSLIVANFYNQSLWANCIGIKGSIEESLEYFESKVPNLLNVIKKVNLLNLH
ncbi:MULTISPECIES: restriction endonuclease [Acinetobacter]|uniref:restriction endonuclease n=2 Tax=Moraxellaceae TaxID=468 RepID=UPI0014394857|nr:restriction endonuclease [Acinetobacter sp. Gutcm_16]MDD0801409.1 restriction endonuclease [Acinetobacter sp. Gutcm_16]NKG36678.1 hypothetical protein [Acinetobacter johnsonii]